MINMGFLLMAGMLHMAAAQSMTEFPERALGPVTKTKKTSKKKKTSIQKVSSTPSIVRTKEDLDTAARMQPQVSIQDLLEDLNMQTHE